MEKAKIVYLKKNNNILEYKKKTSKEILEILQIINGASYAIELVELLRNEDVRKGTSCSAVLNHTNRVREFCVLAAFLGISRSGESS